MSKRTYCWLCSLIERFKNSSKLRRYKIEELIQNESMQSFSQFQSREESQQEYYGYNGSTRNSSNMFAIDEDGKQSICSVNRTLYLEEWKQGAQNTVVELRSRMDSQITFINADFGRDFVVTGDCYGYVMIQRISSGEILFPKTQLFNKGDKLISSSILNEFLCVGNTDYDIKTFNLENFSQNDQLTFRYENKWLSSLEIVALGSEAYVIAAGNK